MLEKSYFLVRLEYDSGTLFQMIHALSSRQALNFASDQFCQTHPDDRLFSVVVYVPFDCEVYDA